MANIGQNLVSAAFKSKSVQGVAASTSDSGISGISSRSDSISDSGGIISKTRGGSTSGSTSGMSLGGSGDSVSQSKSKRPLLGGLGALDGDRYECVCVLCVRTSSVC